MQRPRNATGTILVLACTSLAPSCALHFEGRDGDQAEAGAALEAFKRDIGISGAPAARAAVPDHAAAQLGQGPLDAATRDAFNGERLRARQVLEAALAGSRDLDRLPTGAGRVGRLARAIGLLELGRPDESAAILRAVLDEEPRFFPARDYLAETWMLRRGYAKAEPMWRDLTAAFPAEPMFRFRLADSLFGQKKPAKTAEATRLLEAMIDGPYGVHAATRLSNRYLDLLRARDAEVVLRRAAARHADDRELAFRIGQAQRYEGKHDAAIRTLAPIAETVGPFQPEAVWELVWAYRGLGKPGAALARLDDLEKGNFAAFVHRVRPVLPALREDLEQERKLGRRVTFSPYELRHRLRESKDPAVRKHALRVLAANAARVSTLAADLRHVLREDADDDVRLEAFLALRTLHPEDPEPVLLLLCDRAPINRMRAAGQLEHVDRVVATKCLCDALRAENVPQAFTYLHRSLEKLTGESFFLETSAANDAAGRKRVCAEWVRRLGPDHGAGEGR